jgi:hypothetical protein
LFFENNLKLRVKERSAYMSILSSLWHNNKAMVVGGTEEKKEVRLAYLESVVTISCRLNFL